MLTRLTDLVHCLRQLLLQGLIALLQQVVPLQKGLADPGGQLQVSIPLFRVSRPTGLSDFTGGDGK